MSAENFTVETRELQNVEAKILTKRAEISKFEMEYREVYVPLGLPIFCLHCSYEFYFLIHMKLTGIGKIQRDDRQICSGNERGEFFASYNLNIMQMHIFLSTFAWSITIVTLNPAVDR